MPKPLSISAAAVAAILGIVYIGQSFTYVIPQDEGELFTYAWLMLHGALPYRDIWMMYPPSTYALIAGLMKVGVPGPVAERGLGFGVRLLYVIVVNRTLSGSWRRVSWLALFASLSYLFLASSDMRAYPWIVAMPPAFAGIAYIARDPLRAAVLLFIAGFIRYEFALVGCSLFLVLLVYDVACRRSVKRLALGLALLVSLTVAYYSLLTLWTGPAALQDIFVDPVKYIGPTQHSRLFPPTFGWLFLPIELLVAVGPIGLIVQALRLRDRAALVAGAGAIAFLPHFVNTADVSHLFSVACLSVPLLMMGVFVTRPLSARAASFSVGALAAVTAWTTLIVLAYGVYLSPLSPLSPQPAATVANRLIHSPRGVVIASSQGEARDTRAVLRFLAQHARGDQRLFVAPQSIGSTYTMTDLYYLSGLTPATRYLEFERGVVTRQPVQQEIISNLARCRWVVVVRGGAWYSPAASWVKASALDRYIRIHYRPVLQNGTYAVLEIGRPESDGSGNSNR